MASLPHIAIVLFQPQDIVNVASVIRVMSNFGLTTLRLVEPAAFDAHRISGIAHHTDQISATTERYPTLAQAVADCDFVAGTTGRMREKQHRILTPRQAAPLLLQATDSPLERRAAVLLGPERDGLPNEALERCHAVITIPTHPANRSLNLAQAALVIAYELWMAAFDAPISLPVERLADAAERETMFGALQALLVALYPGTTAARMQGAMARMRSMLMRSAPLQAEAIAFTNLLRHAVRVLHTPNKESRFD